jgi:hypothetical protein
MLGRAFVEIGRRSLAIETSKADSQAFFHEGITAFENRDRIKGCTESPRDRVIDTIQLADAHYHLGMMHLGMMEDNLLQLLIASELYKGVIPFTQGRDRAESYLRLGDALEAAGESGGGIQEFREAGDAYDQGLAPLSDGSGEDKVLMTRLKAGRAKVQTFLDSYERARSLMEQNRSSNR